MTALPRSRLHACFRGFPEKGGGSILGIKMEQWHDAHDDLPLPDTRCEIILDTGAHHLAHFGRTLFFDIDMAEAIETAHVEAWRELNL